MVQTSNKQGTSAMIQGFASRLYDPVDRTPAIPFVIRDKRENAVFFPSAKPGFIDAD